MATSRRWPRRRRWRPHIRLGARVTAVARQGFDKMKTDGREAAPFVLHVADEHGEEDGVAGAGGHRRLRYLGDAEPARGQRAARAG